MHIIDDRGALNTSVGGAVVVVGRDNFRDTLEHLHVHRRSANMRDVASTPASPRNQCVGAASKEVELTGRVSVHVLVHAPALGIGAGGEGLVRQDGVNADAGGGWKGVASKLELASERLHVRVAGPKYCRDRPT